MNHFHRSNKSKEVIIPEADFMVLRYIWNTTTGGRDLDTYTCFTNSSFDINYEYVGWSENSTVDVNGNIILNWGGDDTGGDGGTEAVLIDFKKISELDPLIDVFRTDSNVLWYSGLVNGNFQIELEAYLGGEMVNNPDKPKDFINIGGESVFKQTLPFVSTNDDRTRPGDLVSYIEYDTLTKTARLLRA